MSPNTFCGNAFFVCRPCGSVITRRCHPAPPLRLDEANSVPLAAAGATQTAAPLPTPEPPDRLLRGGKIGCRQHEAGTAALG